MPVVPDCNADTLANSLYTSLTSSAPTPPTIDLTDPQFTFTVDSQSPLYEDSDPISLEDLTQVSLTGDGVFDKLMAAIDLHINREFKDSRITADQYAEVYSNAIQSVLSTSASFLLGKEQAKWNAIEAQMKARVAEISATEALITLERAKADTAKTVFDMHNSGAQFALTKMQTANADAQHCMIKAQTARENFSVDELMPLERDIQSYQLNTALPAKTGIDLFQLNDLFPVTLAQEQHKLTCTLPLQSELLREQVEVQRGQTLDKRRDGMTPISGVIGAQKQNIQLEIEAKRFNIDNTLPIQLALVEEQREAERAKTLDTRSDNTVVAGSIGKQVELYSEQIESFDKDAKYKAGKMYLDAWITQKTIDEGVTPPTELQNTAINAVIAGVRAINDL